jgi:pilus assembly protein Flp/PilA
MMNQVKALWNRFRNEECGATMVEYGLIVALVAVVLITGVMAFEDGLTAVFSDATAGLGGTAP